MVAGQVKSAGRDRHARVQALKCPRAQRSDPALQRFSLTGEETQVVQDRSGKLLATPPRP